MKWFLSAVHLFPPSFSSLFRIAARVSLRGAGPMGPMGGTEKFRLGAGSQVACTPPVHLLSYLFHLVARLSGRSTLVHDVLNFSSTRSSLFSIYLFFGKEIDERARAASFTCVQTALTGTRVTVVRIAADTHAPRGYPAGTVHRMSVYRVYRVYRLTSRTLLWFTDHLPTIWSPFRLRENFIERKIMCRNFWTFKFNPLL